MEDEVNWSCAIFVVQNNAHTKFSISLQEDLSLPIAIFHWSSSLIKYRFSFHTPISFYWRPCSGVVHIKPKSLIFRPFLTPPPRHQASSGGKRPPLMMTSFYWLFIRFIQFLRETNDIVIYSGYINGNVISNISYQNEIKEGLLNSVTSIFICGT